MVWDKLAKLRDKTQAAILKDKTEPYSVRIPAAIKHAKELIGPQLYIRRGKGPFVYITVGEVALAEALWDEFSRPYDGEYPPALIAFTEKVEKLT